MSTVTRGNSPRGEVAESVKQVNVGKREPVDWMIIAHQDKEMIKRVATVVGADSSVTVDVPQSQWDAEVEGFESALSWSIVDGNARKLLLVGHSEAVDGPSEEPVSDGDRIFVGARKVLAQAQAAKDHFATQVESILDRDETKAAIESGSVKLTALFYLAHCDTFMLYDLASKTYRPLG